MVWCSSKLAEVRRSLDPLSSCAVVKAVLCCQWKRRVDSAWEPSGSDCGLGHPRAAFCREDICGFPATPAGGCGAVSVLVRR